jgi:hypothetical protein
MFNSIAEDRIAIEVRDLTASERHSFVMPTGRVIPGAAYDISSFAFAQLLSRRKEL